MNRKQFSRKLAENYNITYQSSDEMCRILFEYLGKVLYEDNEDVSIIGFGAFKHKQAKAKNVRHPTTGRIITQPAHGYVKFIPSELLTQQDNENDK